ncbi:MAG: NAD(P)/FAD-dependent oxidoreductase [Vulcanibacillus sp.]
MNYDVLIIGGGPAGMAAAIAAKQRGNKVLLIEKNIKLGLKMHISGGGRCNFTNICPIDKFIDNIPGNGKFLYSALNCFSNKDLIDFVEKDLKVKTSVEDHGKVFPASNKSETLIQALENYLDNIGVEIIYESSVIEIITDEIKVIGILLKGNRTIYGKSIVLATGGLSYSHTGSSGDGQRMSESLGHKVTQLFPSLVPLICSDFVISSKELQGLSLNNIELSLFNTDNKCVKREYGDMIFTHFGVSGPAVLKLSRNVSEIYKELGKVPLKLKIDLFPDETEDIILDKINNLIKEFPKKSTNNGLKDLLQDKFLRYIIKNENIELKKMIELNKNDINKIINKVKNFNLTISDTKPLEEAMITAGGIDIKEVNPKTLGSKLISGLFFAGEILDFDAYTGGYNIQIAFSTGYTAGISTNNYISTYRN